MRKLSKIELFIQELEELSRKHGFVIQGCGCCGSPYVYKMDETQKNGQYTGTMSCEESEDDCSLDYLYWKVSND